MKDAFGEKIKVGDLIIYSVNNSAGTNYIIGKIAKLYPPPDRVAIKPIKITGSIQFTKDPIIYASNVVLIKQLKTHEKTKSATN